MAEMELLVSAEFPAWEEGFRELSRGPSPEMRDEWEQASESLFAVSDAIVHVLTGRLKASGSVRVDDHGSVLETVLEYDTEYAIYEHERGGSHAWMDRAWAATEEDFERALERGWLRTVRSWR